jgi:hypothetical protein
MLMAALVLVVRLAGSLVPMPMDDPAQALASQNPLVARAFAVAGLAICHADDAGGTRADHNPVQPPDRRDHDCGLCPICHFLAASALPQAGMSVPRPILFARQYLPGQPPPATGPPRAQRDAARPRAPPILSA